MGDVSERAAAAAAKAVWGGPGDACFAPGCGASAASSPLFSCGQCQAAAYCGAACQRAHWERGHRAECAATARAAFDLRVALAAAASGAARAGLLHNQALAYAHGRGVARDEARAVALWRAAASAEANTNLGCGYGDAVFGLPQSWERAHFFFERGAALGDALAMFNLYLRHAQGQGVPRGARAAHAWLERAAAAGHPDALKCLADALWAGHAAVGLRADQARARELWGRAAREGGPTPAAAEAALRHGNCCRDAQGGPRDAPAAVASYRRAAAAGVADAMTALGKMLGEGDGAPRDERAALDWYERAAAAGDANALSNLGNVHGDGRLGVARDVPRAVAFWERAAALGHAQAAYMVGVAHEALLPPAARDAARARAAFAAAAEGGFAPAALHLAAAARAAGAAAGDARAGDGASALAAALARAMLAPPELAAARAGAAKPPPGDDLD